MALLLPAVQAAREAARRSHCEKNLEQFIIAIHNYEMLHGVYPPGTINDQGPIQSLPNGFHHNWITQILPYLEESNAYHQIDRRVSVYDPANQPVRQHFIRILKCPSQPGVVRGYGDYAGVHNDAEVPIDVNNNGTFFLNSRVEYFDVRDGVSNTLFVGEKMTFAGDLGWMSGTRATLRNTGVTINTKFGGWGRLRNRATPTGWPPGVVTSVGDVESIPDDKLLLELLFGGPEEQLPTRAPPTKTRAPPPPPRRDDLPQYEAWGISQQPTLYVLGPPPTNASLAVGGFGSYHPGGSQFALGDGSVRFMSQTTDVLLYLNLGNRADNQLTNHAW